MGKLIVAVVLLVSGCIELNHRAQDEFLVWWILTNGGQTGVATGALYGQNP